MISTILTLIGGIKGEIIGAIGLLGGLWVLWMKRKNRNLQVENTELKQVNRMHEAKEKVHEQDRALETEADKQIEEIHEKVNQADTPEQAAQVVADGLNQFFNPDK